MPTGYLRHDRGVSRRHQRGNGSGSMHGRIKDKQYDNEFCEAWDEMRWRRDMDVDKPPPPNALPPQEIAGTCSMCLQEGSVIDVAKCKHTACLGCLRRYYLQKDLDLYPLHCFACDRRVSVQQLRRQQVIASEDAVKMLHRFQQLHRLRDSNAFSQCPFCHFITVVHTAGLQASRTMHCKRCHDRYAYVPAVTSQDVTEVSAAIADFSRCPRCGMGIQKAGGCNHVWCLYCKGQFDWGAGLRTAQQIFDQELASI